MQYVASCQVLTLSSNTHSKLCTPDKYLLSDVKAFVRFMFVGFYKFTIQNTHINVAI